MTTKQYTGLLAIVCLLASPFVANQWLRFAKAQHEYQEQLEAQRRQAAFERQQLVEAAVEALKNTPVWKQWDSFAHVVDQLQKDKDTNEEEEYPDSSGCSRELLTQLASAIRKQDFNGFNELMKRVPPETLKIYFHYPDLTEPGLTKSDVQDLSKFIKPPPPNYAAKFSTYIAKDLKSVTETLTGITDAASAKAGVLRLLEVEFAVDNSHRLWAQVPDAAKPSIKTALGSGISNVEQLVGKVTATVPGAGDIIGPVAKRLIEELKSF